MIKNENQNTPNEELEVNPLGKEEKKRKKKKKGFDFNEVLRKLDELKNESSSEEEQDYNVEYETNLDIEDNWEKAVTETELDDVYKWYAIRCISGREKRVRRYILAELERLGYKDYVKELVIPIVRAYRNIKGKRQLYDKSLMPGYLLYKGIVNAEIVQAVNSTTDVVGFVGSSKTQLPPPLEEAEVKRLLAAMYSDIESAGLGEISFVSGEVVRIVDGPFEGFEGRVEEVDTKRKRLKVVINIFGRETTVDLNFVQAEKIK